MDSCSDCQHRRHQFSRLILCPPKTEKRERNQKVRAGGIWVICCMISDKLIIVLESGTGETTDELVQF